MLNLTAISALHVAVPCTTAPEGRALQNTQKNPNTTKLFFILYIYIYFLLNLTCIVVGIIPHQGAGDQVGLEKVGGPTQTWKPRCPFALKFPGCSCKYCKVKLLNSWDVFPSSPHFKNSVIFVLNSSLQGVTLVSYSAYQQWVFLHLIISIWQAESFRICFSLWLNLSDYLPPGKRLARRTGSTNSPSSAPLCLKLLGHKGMSNAGSTSLQSETALMEIRSWKLHKVRIWNSVNRLNSQLTGNSGFFRLALTGLCICSCDFWNKKSASDFS